MHAAHFTIIDGRIRLYLPYAGEWTYVDWPWMLATMGTERAWFVHVGPVDVRTYQDAR